MSRAGLGLGAMGMTLALIGVLRDDRRLVWGAMAAIAVALALRIVGNRRRPTDSG